MGKLAGAAETARTVDQVSSAIDKSRVRKVHLSTHTRGCLYCLSPDEAFTGEEHTIPVAFGPATTEFVLPPGAVCDSCNHFLGRQVDSAFLNRFDIRLTRALEGARGRGGVIDMIEGRPPHSALLDLQLGDGKARLHAAKVENDGDEVTFEIRPKARDPLDIVSRRIRALWKMALGGIWLGDREQALDTTWDPIRCAVLGHRFSAYLLSRQFMAIRTGRLDLTVDSQHPLTPARGAFPLRRRRARGSRAAEGQALPGRD